MEARLQNLKRESHMQRWKSVARRYTDLNPEPGGMHNQTEMNRLRVWLEDDVVPLLVEVTRLTRFRELSTFSSRTLVRGSTADQRRVVERVDRGLIDAARALLSVVDDPSVYATLQNMPSTPIFLNGEETVEIGIAIDHNTPVLTSAETTVSTIRDGLGLGIAAVRRVAERDWDDLVEPEDYFSTRQEFVEGDAGTRLQRGEMINGLNARLLPIGDLVARSLRRRIDVRLGVIRDLQRRINQVLADPQLRRPVRWHHAEEELVEAIRQLETMVFADPDSILRDSCVILTQVYAAVNPSPELDWLGIRDELLVEARGVFPALLQGPMGSVIHDRIARAVEDMGQLYRGFDPTVSELEIAIASGGLVIHLPDQSAWWEGTPINLGNSRKDREFLAILARKAFRRLAVGEADLYLDGSQSKSTMATRWGRLGPLLPRSLAQRIQPGHHPRTYQLHLESHRIFLIPGR